VLHVEAGIAVLALTLPRLALMPLFRKPLPIARQGCMANRLGASVHGLLYLLLLLLPASGMLKLLAAGNPASIFGWPVPAWADGSRQMARPFKAIHELLGNVMIGVASLHAAAALWHQFVRRDGLMRRMSLRRPSHNDG
jgi:cytochrome b561